jgi:hypothetical protein
MTSKILARSLSEIRMRKRNALRPLVIGYAIVIVVSFPDAVQARW